MTLIRWSLVLSHIGSVPVGLVVGVETVIATTQSWPVRKITPDLYAAGSLHIGYSKTDGRPTLCDDEGQAYSFGEDGGLYHLAVAVEERKEEGKPVLAPNKCASRD